MINKYLHLLSCILFISSCGADSEDTPIDSSFVSSLIKDKDYITSNQNNSFFLSTLLEKQKSCADIENHLRAKALDDYSENILSQTDDLIVLDSAIESLSPMAEAFTQSRDSMSQEASFESASNYSKTNIQTTGVDEGDLYKTDGKHIFHVFDDHLYISRIHPQTEAKFISSLDLEASGKDIFLDSERKNLFIFAHKHKTYTDLPIMIQDIEVPSFESEVFDFSYFATQEEMWQEDFFDEEKNEIIIVNISDLHKPSISKKFQFTGNYLSSRMIDNKIYFILKDDLNFYNQAVSSNLFAPEYISQSQRLEIIKEELKTQNLEDWIKKIKIFPNPKDESEIFSELPLNCNNFYIPSIKSRLGLSRILTLDTSTQQISESFFLSGSQSIYMSKSSLYLNNEYWEYPPSNGSTLNYSFIHRFSLLENLNPTYKGSAVIKGHLLNQFSMDEYNNHLRVASTFDENITSLETSSSSDTQEREDFVSFQRQSQKNKITIFSLEEDHLKQVGESPDLAEGERIYSVRFAKDKAYMVTFKQTDPLFTFDLSIPSKPIVKGELKIPGFSNYIHQLDENHLLTIGQDADETTGFAKNLKISLFDVSDLKTPREVDVFIAEKNYHSEAQWNHHAFSYYNLSKQLAIPVSYFDSSKYDYKKKEATLVFYIDSNYHINKQEEISFDSIFNEKKMFKIQRQLFTTDNEGKSRLHTISNLGIFSLDTSNLSSSPSIIKYPCTRCALDE